MRSGPTSLQGAVGLIAACNKGLNRTDKEKAAVTPSLFTELPGRGLLGSRACIRAHAYTVLGCRQASLISELPRRVLLGNSELPVYGILGNLVFPVLDVALILLPTVNHP